MSAGLGRVREVMADEGARGVVRRGLGSTLYRRLNLIARSIDRNGTGAVIDGLTCGGLGDAASLEAYGRLRPDTPAAEVIRRLEAGQRCVLVELEGEPVSARWFTRERAEFEYLGLGFGLEPGVAYVFDVYTARAARGKRISSSARHVYERTLRAEGVQRLLGGVMPGNKMGEGLARGAGYSAIGHVGSVRAGHARIPVRRFEPGYLGAADRLGVPWTVGSPSGA